MKKVLALVLAVLLLAALTPMAFAASATVNVSVSVDGKLLVAAQPVSVSEMTLDAALKAANKAYFSGGEAGYASGVDATWGVFLISKCWGVTATPFVMVNDEPLGKDSAKGFADTYPVKAGDNIIIATSSDPNVPATALSMTSSVSGTNATVTAKQWVLDFTTFAYTSTAFANAKIVDPATGTALGTTDANGSATVAIPASGVVAVDGLAAIKVAEAAAGAAAPAALPQTGGASVSTIVCFVGLGILAIGATTLIVNKKRTGESI